MNDQGVNSGTDARDRQNHRIKINPEKAKAIQSTMLKSAIWLASLILLIFALAGIVVFLARIRKIGYYQHRSRILRDGFIAVRLIFNEFHKDGTFKRCEGQEGRALTQIQSWELPCGQ